MSCSLNDRARCAALVQAARDFVAGTPAERGWCRFRDGLRDALDALDRTAEAVECFDAEARQAIVNMATAQAALAIQRHVERNGPAELRSQLRALGIEVSSC